MSVHALTSTHRLWYNLLRVGWDLPMSFIGVLSLRTGFWWLLFYHWVTETVADAKHNHTFSFTTERVAANEFPRFFFSPSSCFWISQPSFSICWAQTPEAVCVADGPFSLSWLLAASAVRSLLQRSSEQSGYRIRETERERGESSFALLV